MCLHCRLNDLADYRSGGKLKKFQKQKVCYEIQRRALSFSNALMY